MAISALRPVVGYPGSKYRILDRIRPFLAPEDIDIYVEPFVGMGAVYLDLRARGFEGRAILADANPEVANFWRFCHDERGEELVARCRRLEDWPRTTEDFRRMKAEPVEDPIERVARFLWLTRFSFGSQPPHYTGTGWSGRGSRFESEYRLNRPVLWIKNVGFLATIVTALRGRSCLVADDGIAVLGRTTAQVTVYADPPYMGRHSYDGKHVSGRFIRAVLEARAKRIVLSEQSPVEPLPEGWAVHADQMTNKASGGSGCSGKRTEYLYVRG